MNIRTLIRVYTNPKTQTPKPQTPNPKRLNAAQLRQRCAPGWFLSCIATDLHGIVCGTSDGGLLRVSWSPSSLNLIVWLRLDWYRGGVTSEKVF